MGRGDYRADRSQRDVSELFRRLIGDVGPNEYEARLLAIPFGGSTLGDVQARLRKPDSSYYEKSYLEALATARTLVKLGLDGDVADITTRDRPDVVVHHQSGQLTYVEHTIAGDPDVVSFPRHMEEASLALRELARTSVSLDMPLRAGYFQVRLADPGTSRRARPAELAQAVLDLLPSWQGGAQALHSTRAPLATYNAQVFYKPGGPANSAFFQRQGGFVGPPDSARHVIRSIRKKRNDAGTFDSTLRPLWLIVTPSTEHTYDIDGSDRAEIETALEAEDTVTPFDRVIVELMDSPPLVRDG
jgi:hypothetical protein